jgi:hypothetical protein
MLSALTAMPRTGRDELAKAEADAELEACRESLRAERAALAQGACAEPDDLVLCDDTGEAQELALSAAHLLDLPAPPADMVLAPIVPYSRAPAPAAVVAAPPNQLAQVLEKFGPEAYEDVQDVLHTEPAARANPTAALDALDRLLEMQPSDFKKSAGACYRAFVRKAGMGDLRLAKTHPRGGTHLHRLERERDAAAQRRDFDAANALKEKMFAVGQHVQEQVAALRQLLPKSSEFSVSTRRPACNVLRLPEPASRQTPRCLPPPPTPSQERVADALRAQLMLRYLTPGQRAKLEQELAEVEAAIAASPSLALTSTTEEPHVQQGPQTSP